MAFISVTIMVSVPANPSNKLMINVRSGTRAILVKLSGTALLIEEHPLPWRKAPSMNIATGPEVKPRDSSVYSMKLGIFRPRREISTPIRMDQINGFLVSY